MAWVHVRHTLAVLAGHTSSVTAIAVAPDGRFIASAALDYTVRVWDLKTLSVLRVLSAHTDVR